MPAGLHTRDASGRRVSILNDDHSPHFTTGVSPIVTPSYDPRAPRTASTPATPELLRSNSYDSHMAAVEPASPLTPLYDPGFRYNPPAPEYRSVYEDYYVEGTHVHAGMKRRPSAFSDGRSVTYDDDLYHTAPTTVVSCSSSSSSSPSSSSSSSSSSSPPSTSTATSSTTIPGSERPGKRFPCRYRETHGCDKTFTTSGHASRHAKIHTAEKGVNCSFEGCPKRFTRADNMKQHLETHYKDKSRSSISRPSVSGGRRSSSASSSSSSLGKLSSSSSLSSASAAASRNRIMAMTTAAMAAIAATATAQSSPSPPPPSSSSSSLPRMNGLEPALFRGMPVQPPPNGSAWDMRDLDDKLVNRTSTRDALPTRTGLDTLALAALRQGSGR
ncbi:hypothetical protein MYCTH_2313746 [Thermothelomyces thermophilus ATCC 42464]|uniref:C2H2-type domain-containing protein n=1 Tax=Thermothelomyces thermophilus (strain ATCC 42464 / BCRC 31852 / DSM 1799) TaxID=573729 RepID=G2Q2D8_THET4|nr:uncharacterized protein MYCTH_2313746 [Thermothelomyces thermophilus ATCC 42464]AEO54263.1 hypothetical protein MYCTH_2313746 [Thermothelomyces thermophilus ATCC 42464]